MNSRTLLARLKLVFVGFVLIVALGLMPRNAVAQDLTTALNALIPQTGMGLTLNSSVFVAAADSGNVSELRTRILSDWVMPDATVTGSSIAIAGIGRVGDQNFSGSQLAPYRDFLAAGTASLQPGDKVFQLSWTLTDPVSGTFHFTTLGYEDSASTAKFEPFVFSAPLNDAFITVTNPGTLNDVDFSTSNAFGITTFGGGNLSISCDAGKVTKAIATIGQTGSNPLWEAQTTKEPPVIFTSDGMQCASAVFHYGFTSGFKSINVGADGITLGFSGALGWSGSTESIVTKCCTPVPEASSLISLALLIALGLLGVLARRGFRYLIAETAANWSFSAGYNAWYTP